MYIIKLPRFVTLTGADDTVSVGDLRTFVNSIEEPIELGILISLDRQGTDRYPSQNWIYELIAQRHKFDCYLSFHLCGRAVHEWLKGSVYLNRIIRYTNRVQLNFNQKINPINTNELKITLESYKNYSNIIPSIIIQQNKNNEELNNTPLWDNNENLHEFLYDSSGGRGESPLKWDAPNPKFRSCGYAGGLNVNNISDEIYKISKAISFMENMGIWENYWVDLETGLRNENNEFDLDKCKEIVKKVYT